VESLFVLVPLALIFIVVAIKVFSWAVNSGQYDDLDTEAHRILFDDAPVKPQPKDKVAAKHVPSEVTGITSKPPTAPE